MWKPALNESKKHFRTAYSMSYITLSVLKDNRLLIKILSELSKSVQSLITALVQLEHENSKIQIFKSPELNFQLFQEKVAQKYLTKKELSDMLEIIELEKKHLQSASEFLRNDKFVIFLGNTYKTISLEKIKEYLVTLRKIFLKFPYT